MGNVDAFLKSLQAFDKDNIPIVCVDKVCHLLTSVSVIPRILDITNRFAICKMSMTLYLVYPGGEGLHQQPRIQPQQHQI